MASKAFFASQPPREPDFAAQSPQPAHGRIEKREIWTATEPVAGISFPWVGQVFLIKRTTRSCRCRRNGNPARLGEPKVELVYGITSHTPQSADAEAILGFNRRHWTCENRVHRILDDAATWNEDKCQVRERPWPGEPLLPPKTGDRPHPRTRQAGQADHRKAEPEPASRARLSPAQPEHAATLKVCRIAPQGAITASSPTNPARSCQADRSGVARIARQRRNIAANHAAPPKTPARRPDDNNRRNK